MRIHPSKAAIASLGLIVLLTSKQISAKTVKQVTQPDLTVTGMTVSPKSPKAGANLIFSATIRNGGTAPTPAGKVLGIAFSVDGTEVSWSDTYSNSLQPGASITLMANAGTSGAGWFASTGIHTVIAQVNDVQRISESNYNNNSLSKRLNVLPADVALPVSIPASSQASSTVIAEPGRKGLCVDFLQLNATDLEAQMADVAKLGVSYIRLDFDWSQMQPDNSATYNTTAWDRVVASAQKHAVHVLGIIDYSPSWASGHSDSQMYPPIRASTYGTFASYLAKRYGPMGVHAWEIWNEPNLASVFWISGADPTGYTALLKAAYPAIKSADATATVITAGLSPADSYGLNMSPQDFLKGIYASGGRNFFDAVGDHPYTYPALPTATDGSAYWWTAMVDLRAIMIANGDDAKKIWMTEFGGPTDGGSDDMTEAQQAAMITAAYKLQATYSWAGPLFIYEYKDAGTSLSTEENFFGIIRADGSPKLSYTALKAVSN